ncbi:MAG: hypothetical protein AMXMBFR8_24910 [Nevskiales bacterium]
MDPVVPPGGRPVLSVDPERNAPLGSSPIGGTPAPVSRKREWSGPVSAGRRLRGLPTTRRTAFLLRNERPGVGAGRHSEPGSLSGDRVFRYVKQALRVPDIGVKWPQP